MTRNPVLLIDALINLLLGVLLLAFSHDLVKLLGLPQTEQSFYPTILGAVLFGIGLALLLEYGGRPQGVLSRNSIAAQKWAASIGNECRNRFA
jgi:uncharacterized membrane-anchored protein YitT (DUF2179 family)